MNPTEEIIPGFKIPERELVRYAEDQLEYITLPAWQSGDVDGRIVTRWRLTWRERLCMLFGGSIWLSVLTFRRPLQPVRLDTICPLQGSAMLDEEI